MMGMFKEKAFASKPMTWKKWAFWHLVMYGVIILFALVLSWVGCASSQVRPDPKRPTKATPESKDFPPVKSTWVPPKPTKEWYRGISVDVGLDLKGDLYPYTGISIPVSIFSFSGGVWSDAEGDLGWYMGAGYSWLPFE